MTEYVQTNGVSVIAMPFEILQMLWGMFKRINIILSVGWNLRFNGRMSEEESNKLRVIMPARGT